MLKRTPVGRNQMRPDHWNGSSSPNNLPEKECTVKIRVAEATNLMQSDVFFELDVFFFTFYYSVL